MLFLWRNPMTWDPLLRATVGRKPSVSRVVSVLQSEYTGVRTFHGCRPRDANTYYRDGIQVSNIKDLDSQARKIFLTDEFPEISSTVIETAIQRIHTFDHRAVHVIIDDRVLLQHAGHYLVYGSERICAIAAALGRDGFAPTTIAVGGR